MSNSWNVTCFFNNSFTKKLVYSSTEKHKLTLKLCKPVWAVPATVYLRGRVGLLWVGKETIPLILVLFFIDKRVSPKIATTTANKYAYSCIPMLLKKFGTWITIDSLNKAYIPTFSCKWALLSKVCTKGLEYFIWLTAGSAIQVFRIIEIVELFADSQ